MMTTRTVLSVVMDTSLWEDSFLWRNRSLILSKLSFSWCLDIHSETSARQAAVSALCQMGEWQEKLDIMSIAVLETKWVKQRAQDRVLWNLWNTLNRNGGYDLPPIYNRLLSCEQVRSLDIPCQISVSEPPQFAEERLVRYGRKL